MFERRNVLHRGCRRRCGRWPEPYSLERSGEEEGSWQDGGCGDGGDGDGGGGVVMRVMNRIRINNGTQTETHFFTGETGVLLTSTM